MNVSGYETPAVVIVGAGAMGSVFGGLLAEGGLDVTLVDVWEAHVAAINRDGLRLVGHGGDRTIRVRAVQDVSAVASADVVFFQCKATATTAAASSARHLFARGHTTAISFQNGLGNEDVLAQVLGPANVVAGLTAQAALLEAPGRVRNFAHLPSYIGEVAGGLSPRVEALARAFTAAGLPTQASADIMREKWSKLLVNIAFAGTSGLTGLTLGEVISDETLRLVATQAMDEAAAVARAVGIDLDPQAQRAVFDKIMNSEARHNKASLLADLEAGKATEVDVIYGTAIRLADQHRVPVPTLETLAALIKGRGRARTG